jgi:hypothetical protein
VLFEASAPADARFEPRIVNPEPTVERVPYQAAVLFQRFQVCGGTLRDATHVITAAHCVEDGSPDGVEVAADFVTLGPAEETVQIAPVVRVSIHPGYDAVTNANDAAVLTLGAPIADTAGVRFLPLGSAGAVAANGSDAVISGWGDLFSGSEEGSVELRHGFVDVQSDDDCADRYALAPDGPVTIVGSLMVCAGRVDGSVSTDTCQGDSGGPLAQGSSIGAATRLIGITSFGEGCGDPDFPGVYAEVAAPGIHGFVSRASFASAPVNERRPRIDGAAVTGEVVTCDAGDWAGDPIAPEITFEKRWLRDGTEVAAGDSYRLDAEDAGRVVQCRVRATNAGGGADAVSAGASCAASARRDQADLAHLARSLRASSVPSGRHRERCRRSQRRAATRSASAAELQARATRAALPSGAHATRSNPRPRPVRRPDRRAGTRALPRHRGRLRRRRQPPAARGAEDVQDPSRLARGGTLES